MLHTFADFNNAIFYFIVLILGRVKYVFLSYINLHRHPSSVNGMEAAACPSTLSWFASVMRPQLAQGLHLWRSEQVTSGLFCPVGFMVVSFDISWLVLELYTVGIPRLLHRTNIYGIVTV